MASSNFGRADSRRESIREISARPHWEGIINVDDIDRLVILGHISVAGLEKLDRIISVAVRHKEVDVAALRSGTLEMTVSDLSLARKTMWRLFDAHPLLRSLDKVIALRSPGSGVRAPYPARARRMSVHLHELPDALQVAFLHMEAGLVGGNGTVPVPAMIITMRTKVCELAKAAKDVGLSVSMCVETVTAYERSMATREKPLSPKTVLSSMRQIRDFARYIGISPDLEEHLAARLRLHDARSLRSVPQKEAKIAKLPTYSDIFGLALDLLGRAAAMAHPRRAQHLRNAAVALTLLCPFPLRVADTQLRFGDQIRWEGGEYWLRFHVSKTRRPFNAPVIPVFGFFLDQLILQGAASEHLTRLREDCFARGRALFTNYDDTDVHDRYPSYLWSKYLGTGCHAARTHLHDSFGRLGTRGVELAMAACDHRSERTAEAYRTRAFEMLALEQAQNRITAGIFDAEWQAYFGDGGVAALPLPDGAECDPSDEISPDPLRMEDAK
ncbi:hypothetical protein FBT96_13145 [Rhodobacter capsulatus]|uniref:Uncharacterized protein n=1 Tax=Rhodobacter capsulatus TaxID=1061 RepID=A0A4U1JP98_RHOCA|nr:hypothetical protein [Rhodobacter capsulatus]TKD17653.1 hypothetical protein FBT96_13145 [Rhodobacter capsulatus]